jgi:predicted nucleic-acid-binding Zn-ribbon protein
MPKITVPTKCSKCNSEQIKHEELSMYGRHGVSGRGYRFDAYICTECGYTELFYRERTGWV